METRFFKFEKNRFLLSLSTILVLVVAGLATADTWVTSGTAGVPIKTSTTTSKVGIGITGTANPVNMLDVEGGAAIGSSYSGSNAAPTNGLIVQGKVGIGMVATNATAEQLTVQGNAKVTGTIQADGGIKVKTWSLEVPDYVFDPKQGTPMILEEVEKFVKINRHLPEIPSAVEMHQNGMDLAEMNLMLLKKVEELTLYVIDQNKKIKALSASIRN